MMRLSVRHDLSPSSGSARRSTMPTGRFLALAALIGAGGLALRVVDLAAIPPGLHFDQAANGLLGLEILSGRAHPVFFSSYAGREALFMYLIAALSALLGPGILALRLAGALCGAATVVAVASLGAALFDRRTGLLASAFLAGLYWHLHASRLGERAILVPLLDTLALFVLWKAFQHLSLRLAIAGGGLVGLQLYTYPSSRFFPLAVALVGLAELVNSSTQGPSHLPRRGVLLALSAALAGILVAAPLGFHFLRTPSDFLGRADEVAVWNERVAGPSPAAAAGRSTISTLAMFILHGDADWKYNLAGRPVFDPVSAVFFLAGILLALRHPRQQAGRLCLIWGTSMLLPGFLSVDAPQFMRTLGAAPPAVLLAASGLAAAVDWLRRTAPESVARLAPALYAWPVIAGTLAAYQYFAVWAPSPAAYLALEGDVTDAARLIRTLGPHYSLVYVASRYGPDPTESFLDGDLFGRLHWFDGRAALPLPPPGAGEVLYILPRSASDPSWYRDLPAADRQAVLTAPDHGLAVAAFVLRPGALPVPAGLSARPDFGGVARLVGADVPRAVVTGAELRPVLSWQIDRPPSEPLKFFVHLVDAAGETWAQYDEEVYPSTEWRPGQVLIVRRPLPVPPEAPIGTYSLEVGLEHANGTALSVTGEAGQPAGNAWRSPPLTVIRSGKPPDLSALAIQHRLNARLGDTVRLAGATVGSSTVLDGDSLAVTLVWQALRPPGSDLQTVLTATDSAGRAIASITRAPTGGVWPARDWRTGDVIIDRQHLLIPAGTAPGTLTLWASLHRSDGTPLSPAGGGAAVRIGTIAVQTRPHSTAPVQITHPLTVRLADGIEFLGYDLDAASVRPGQTLVLTLYWRTETPLSRGWTVFTHLLDDHGKVRAQHDGLPAGGERPTTTWAPGETIADRHVLIIPPDTPSGVDRLEIGLYDAATGERLRTASGEDRILLDQSVRVATTPDR
ncbi:MAG: glycosyltransferase family 39 protein [Chloroflexi bacterium]|nr:glycosyltransferase family 39 protein [Chloroflexota bacterium]